jgi:NAD(P)-dependent dehydrogenase (short-subunit alcohol dehydrogenase family)
VFGEPMLAAGYGRIINIASLSTFVALYEVAAYAASKAAVASLTKSLAVEWSKRGVLVNAIAPGVFRTALNSQLLDSTPRGQEFLTRTPMGRFGKTEELVGAAIYLASDAASFVTGEIVTVDGGFLASGVNQ